MSLATPRRGFSPGLPRFARLEPVGLVLAWLVPVSVTARAAGARAAWPIAALGLGTLAWMHLVRRSEERRRWSVPIRAILDRYRSGPESDEEVVPDEGRPEALLSALARRVANLAAGRGDPAVNEIDSPFVQSGEFDIRAIQRGQLSRSLLLESPAGSAYAPSSDASPDDLLSRHDPARLRWLDASPALVELLGWPLETLRAMSLLDIIEEDERELARAQLDAAVLKGEGHNLLYRVRDRAGDPRALEIYLSMRYDDHGSPNHARVRFADMTKKVRADRELRRRTRELIDANAELRRTNRELKHVKDRYSDLYHNAPAMYFSLDRDGMIRGCNQTLLRSLGLGRESVVGQPYSSILGDPRRSAHPTWSGELRGEGRVEIENRWRLSDGKIIDVWISIVPVVGPDGSIEGCRGIARDVTARRALEAELKIKNDRLGRANVELSRKNKELDEFAYIIAHDLKEPLRTLISFSGFLEQDCGDRLDDAGREHIRHIIEAARRMRSLIGDLQELSRAGRTVGDFGPVRVDLVLDRVRHDFAELFRSRCAHVDLVGDPPILWGDANRIGQLLGNLIGNGLKYNRSDCPRVEVEVVPDAAPEVEASRFATLAVRDNGIGIEPKFHGKVFQLFRRLHTREEYEGTGAGLAICQKIAQAHGGRIWVESAGAGGSTFYLTLPMADGEARPIDVDVIAEPV